MVRYDRAIVLCATKKTQRPKALRLTLTFSLYFITTNLSSPLTFDLNCRARSGQTKNAPQFVSQFVEANRKPLQEGIDF
ncbi:MAG: hypothetical protein F6K40_29510 [Okeania sp. SIO3I5]|uniref:hypothetical protein n=1 Tax=Okeania sp. SIO3I5 TaxID=2607805 RepID=UPI0013B640BB|nr:hypothetical protein [Okeania sp. SIO3I5]NEQ40157.1 hypothetical protein [Okeania sp. SIO3I5]